MNAIQQQRVNQSASNTVIGSIPLRVVNDSSIGSKAGGSNGGPSVPTAGDSFKVSFLVQVLFSRLPANLREHVAFRHFYTDELDAGAHALCIKYFTILVLYFCTVFRLEGRRRHFLEQPTERSGREFAAAHKRAQTVFQELSTTYSTILMRYNRHSEISYTARHAILVRGRTSGKAYTNGLKNINQMLEVKEPAFKFESEDFLFYEHLSAFALQIVKLAFAEDTNMQQKSLEQVSEMFRSRSFTFNSQRRREEVRTLEKQLDSDSVSLKDNTLQVAELLTASEPRIIVKYANQQRTPFIQTKFPGGTSFMKFQRPKTNSIEKPQPTKIEKQYTIESELSTFPLDHPAMYRIKLWLMRKRAREAAAANRHVETAAAAGGSSNNNNFLASSVNTSNLNATGRVDANVFDYATTVASPTSPSPSPAASNDNRSTHRPASTTTTNASHHNAATVAGSGPMAAFTLSNGGSRTNATSLPPIRPPSSLNHNNQIQPPLHSSRPASRAEPSRASSTTTGTAATARTTAGRNHTYNNNISITNDDEDGRQTTRRHASSKRQASAAAGNIKNGGGGNSRSVNASVNSVDVFGGDASPTTIGAGIGSHFGSTKFGGGGSSPEGSPTTPAAEGAALSPQQQQDKSESDRAELEEREAKFFEIFLLPRLFSSHAVNNNIGLGGHLPAAIAGAAAVHNHAVAAAAASTTSKAPPPLPYHLIEPNGPLTQTDFKAAQTTVIDAWSNFDLTQEIDGVYQAVANGVVVRDLALPSDIMLCYDEMGILYVNEKNGTPMNLKL